MRNSLFTDKPNVSISGENFSFDKASSVIENSNTVTVIEPDFDETSSKIEWELYEMNAYFHINPEKFYEPVSPKPVKCDIFIYKDVNKKFKLVALKL